MDTKTCWNCKNKVGINDYGYAVCRFCRKVTFGDRKNYVVIPGKPKIKEKK